MVQQIKTLMNNNSKHDKAGKAKKDLLQA